MYSRLVWWPADRPQCGRSLTRALDTLKRPIKSCPISVTGNNEFPAIFHFHRFGTKQETRKCESRQHRQRQATHSLVHSLVRSARPRPQRPVKHLSEAGQPDLLLHTLVASMLCPCVRACVCVSHLPIAPWVTPPTHATDSCLPISSPRPCSPPSLPPPPLGTHLSLASLEILTSGRKK